MKQLIRTVFLLSILLMAACASEEEGSMTNTPIPTPKAEFIQGEGNADVVFVRAEYQENGTWNFAVTINHPDTGWEDYADGWDVLMQDGTVLKPDPDSPFTRLLLHPHVGEQPFTRSQTGISVPDGERYVTVRAHDLVDGYGGQAVVVDLYTAQGALFEVTRPVSALSGTLGLTNHRLDGNRYLNGAINLPGAETIDLPLDGTPSWVVGVPLANDEMIWLAALEDGSLQAFRISGGDYTQLALPVSQLPPGTPPAILGTETGFELLNILTGDGSVLTNPIVLPDGGLAFISENGKLGIQTPSDTLNLDVNAIPDGRLLSDGEGHLLLLTEPSEVYGHAVLGDGLEAKAITFVDLSGADPQVRSFPVPAGQVVEGLAPIWADLDGDGVSEILVTLSDAREGARLSLFSAEGELIASGEPIGSGYRWRHQIAAAPIGPNGELEIIDVLTPHIGGVVEFFQLHGGNLVKVAEVPGYTSHVIGSRNLDMALAADVDADGQVEVLLPNQGRDALGAIRRTAGGAEVDWEVELGDLMVTNIGAITFDDGSLAIAVGLQSGFLRVWLP
jgi:hypothetical protein